MLFVVGCPGCGKTTIVAHAIRFIQSKLNDYRREHSTKAETNLSKSILLYFFFQRSGWDEEGTASSAMKTMISQLVSQIPTSNRILLNQFLLLSTRGSVIWSLDQLWEVFVSILTEERQKRNIYLVLDGLDECDPHSKLALLTKIQLHINSLERQEPTGELYALSFLLSGRPDE